MSKQASKQLALDMHMPRRTFVPRSKRGEVSFLHGVKRTGEGWVSLGNMVEPKVFESPGREHGA